MPAENAPGSAKSGGSAGRKFVLAVLLLAVLGGGAWVWDKKPWLGTGAQKAAPQPRVIAVLAGKAERTSLPVRVEALGTVESMVTVPVRSRVAAAVEKVGFADGATVKEGDLLYQLDPAGDRRADPPGRGDPQPRQGSAGKEPARRGALRGPRHPQRRLAGAGGRCPHHRRRAEGDGGAGRGEPDGAQGAARLLRDPLPRHRPHRCLRGAPRHGDPGGRHAGDGPPARAHLCRLRPARALHRRPQGCEGCQGVLQPSRARARPSPAAPWRSSTTPSSRRPAP